MSRIAKRIVFIGRVQGVGFRFTVFNIASRTGLTGQVRNMPDGSVEMITQGPADCIADCISDIEESYPGCIGEIKTEEITINPKFTDFKITF